MTEFDPFKNLEGARTYQQRVMVRAVRLTRDNASTIARLTGRRLVTASDGTVSLAGPLGGIWVMEGEMLVAVPSRRSIEPHTVAGFRAWYTHPGQPITEEDLAWVSTPTGSKATPRPTPKP